MHHALDCVFLQDSDDLGGVAQRQFVEGGPSVQGLAMAPVEVVDHDRLVPGLDQQLDGVRSDITRPPVTNTFIRLFLNRESATIIPIAHTPTEGLQRQRPWPVANPRRWPTVSKRSIESA